MSRLTTNMSLRVWDLASDHFNHTQLASNWDAVDVHDHTATKGVQIPTGGLVNLAVTTAKIADSNVTTAKIADNSVTTAKVADGQITTAKIADVNVTTAKIADGAITAAKITTAFTRSYSSIALTDFFGGGSNELKYLKDAAGIVHVSFNGAQASSPAPVAGALLCTLPVGYRPTFVASLSLWPAFTTGGPTQVTVEASGAVKTVAALTASTYYNISGSWPAV